MKGGAGRGAATAAGFTLVELLVALAIAAMVVAVAVSALSGALAAQARAEGTVEASIIARTRLATLELEPREGESAGVVEAADRRFAWRVVAVPFLLGPDSATDETALPLLHATVTVEWGGQRRLDASTLVFATQGAAR